MLSIKTVCALTGVNPITLRAWERRYGLIEPERTAKGHRVYSHADVERIQRVLALTRDGVAISQVKDALDAEPAPASGMAGQGPWPEYRRRLGAAIASFDEVALEAIYAEALALHAVSTVDRLLLMPALQKLGARWHKIAGGVAEEHFFSAYVRNKIGARFHHRRVLETGPKILAACAPGDQHEIGLLLFALAAHEAGVRVVMLGANVPFAEAAAAARRAQCNAIVISNTVERDSPEFYDDLKALVASAGRPVYIGGNAVLQREKEIRATGAVPLALSIEAALRGLNTALLGKRSDA